ncbi:hypothetical protein TNIN_104511 [Trichonephila inaurata madagascariensis]|uniref:Uncharacterized protein n=1 Tax=Trichonephila inaurata madagascariensis TaxID=2747483 RepID=A0A8X6JSF4_9ARAC|nr:hypothetical protein TNIN_104511 [Trichonephila inaurata madagascariensis]
MRLKKERWLMEKQMQHVQEKHKMSWKTEEQKCLPEERCKRINTRAKSIVKGTSPDAAAQPVAVEEEKGLSNVLLISAEDETYEEKEEAPVDVIKDKVKEDIDPIILSKQ